MNNIDLPTALNAAIKTMETAVLSSTTTRATIHKTRATEVVQTLRHALERLSTPPSQGKAERARDAANAFYEHIKHGDEKHRAWLKEECDGKLSDLITQALTESSGQGTDGAEAMRDACVAYHTEQETLWDESSGDKAEELVLFHQQAAFALQNLPLPVSADGAVAMRKAAASIAADKSFEGFSISADPDLEAIATVREVEVREAIANSIRALKSKQPSDTERGK